MRRIYTHVGTVESLRVAFNHPQPMTRANYWIGCALFTGLGLTLALVIYFA